MTLSNKETEQLVYFGYGGTLDSPSDTIQSATQVIRAMNDLLNDHNDLGLLGDAGSEARSGIYLVLDACARQLDLAVSKIQGAGQKAGDPIHPRLDDIVERRDECADTVATAQNKQAS
jgi:hypothetical protein